MTETNEALDKILKCVECAQDFIFTAGEQTFFASRRFTPPKRCKTCREKRRQERDERDERDNESDTSRRRR